MANDNLTLSEAGIAKLKKLEDVIDGLYDDSSGYCTHDVETLSHEEIESHQMTVCKAVKDRICKRIDLASRTDLTVQQAIDALRLLLKIVRRNDFANGFFVCRNFLVSALRLVEIAWGDHPPSRRGSFLVFLDLAPRLHEGGGATPENGANLDLLRFYSSLSQRFVRESGGTVTRVPLNKHPLPSVSGETACHHRH
jgi:hypothetical protein